MGVHLNMGGVMRGGRGDERGGDKKYVELIVGRRSVMYCACCGRNHVGQEYNPFSAGCLRI